MTGVDLASRALGGSVVAASDESFGFKERLIDPSEPAFVPGTYDLRGEVVDGWETRRRRDIGPDTHDAVMISFVVPADLQRIEIDTSRFVFNASPEAAVLGSRALPGGEHGWALVPFDVEVLPRTRIAPDARQVFVVDATNITALRVQAYPDGGLARVRAFGSPTADGVAQLESMWEAAC